MNYTFDNIRIVMVNPTEAGNIGAAARAMKNMQLSKLYLVNPCNYPSAEATTRASGADDVLASAFVCTSLKDALRGTHLVVASSARQRSIKLPQMDVVCTCGQIQKILSTSTQKIAVVFGTERIGLTNKELDLCHILMTIPGNIDYFSLNVAAAVQVFAYQNFITNKIIKFTKNTKKLANFDELENFYLHLQHVLQYINYFDKKRPQALLMRRLRRFFNKAKPEKDEVAILRGILKNIKPFSSNFR